MNFQEPSQQTSQTDPGTPGTLESWKEIAAYLQRDAKTARKWEKEEGLPIHRHTHRSRSSVYAYPAEIDRWRATRKVTSEPVTRPLWKLPAFAVTMLLCLVMVGNGVRPQSAEAQQGQTRTLVCSGAACDGGQMLSPTGKLVRPHLEKGCCTQLSPDGSRVAYTRRSGPFSRETAATEEVIVTELDGANARTIYRGGSSYAWSADGKRMLIGVLLPDQPTNVANLLWVDIATGAVRKLPTTHANLDVAKVSPDGKYVAFNASKDGDAEENVYIMESDGSGETLVSPSAAYQEPAGWTSDGKYLLFSQYGASVTLYGAPVIGGKVQGRALDTHVELPRGGFLGVSRSGAIYYKTLSSGSDIFAANMDPATGKVTSAPIPVRVNRTGGNVLPRWAPDSRRLAYYWADPRTSGPSNNRELFVYSFDTGKEERIATQSKLATGGICWSRDGNSILLNNADTPRQPQPARYTLGTNHITPLFPGATPFVIRSCSSELTAGFDATGIKVRSLSNGSEKQVHQFDPNPGVTLPVLSHDGRNVAFVSASAGVSTLRVVSSDGGPARVLASVNAPAEFQTLWGAAWSPDDRSIYFARRADSNSAYDLLRVPSAGGPTETMGLRVEDLRDLDIAPDGTRIAFSIGAVNRPEIWAIKGFLPGK